MEQRSNDRAIAAHNGMGAMPSVGKMDQVFKCGALSRKQRSNARLFSALEAASVEGASASAPLRAATLPLRKWCVSTDNLDTSCCDREGWQE